MILDLCRLQLRVPIDALQKILGKTGRQGSHRARERFVVDLATNAEGLHDICQATLDAVGLHSASIGRTAPHKMPSDNFSFWTASALAPYSSLYLFLAHVFFYACVISMAEEPRHALASVLGNSICHGASSETQGKLVAGLRDPASAGLVLRSGAHLLSMFDTWGCSTNLALLLHWRAKTYDHIAS